ncbi:ankyrin repeat-containing domain protein [Nemania abortiva]|nr:ankyrin repeat-containing domain protein [Nemania abortiva]
MPPSYLLMMASDDWEKHKSRIGLMYSIEGQSLQHIVSYMKEHHSFDKKPTQYEYRLKTWGIKKNASKGVWPYVAHRIRKREKRGKKSEVVLYGIPVPEAKLRKETQRYTNIPTAVEFGMRSPSPKTPEGHIVQVLSPSVMESDPIWPETLPWFQFEHNLIPTLYQSSSFLNVLLAFGSNTMEHQCPKYGSLSHLFSISGDALMLRKAIFDYSNLLPKYHADRSQRTEALVSAPHNHSIAIEMLKVIFFRLSNNLFEVTGFPGRQMHDRLVVQFVDAISHSNPDLLSGLFSDSSRTSNAIKEAIYKSSVRERNCAIVLRLLKSGVDPNLPVEFSMDRWRLPDSLVWNRTAPRPHLFSKFKFRGIEIAAYEIDTRLGEALLLAKANANTSCDDDIHPLVLIGLNLNEASSDKVLEFAHMLIKHDAHVNPSNPKCRHGYVKAFSPLGLAIARHDNVLADFLIKNGAIAYSQIAPCTCNIFLGRCEADLRQSLCGVSFSPLPIAIISGNSEITARLLHPILSQPVQTSQSFIRNVFIASCLVGDRAIVSQLLFGFDIDLTGNWEDGITPLIAAATNPDAAVARILLSSGADIGPKPGSHENDLQISVPTPMHVAAFYANTELVRILIEYGATCNVCYVGSCYIFPKNSFQSPSSPLRLALMNGHIETAALLLPYSEISGGDLAQAVKSGDPIIISELISRGPDVLLASDEGDITALDTAAENGNVGIVSLWFSSGGKYGSSALYLATKSAVKLGDNSLVELLTNYRPAGLIDSNEASCLVIALLEGERSLVDHLLGSFLPGPSPSFYHYSLTSDDKFRLDHRGNGITPLWAACLSCNTFAIKSMIQRGYSFGMGDQRSLYNFISNDTERSNSIMVSFLSIGHLESTNCIGHEMLILCAIKLCDINRIREYITEFVDSLDFALYGWGPSPLGLAVEMDHRELAGQLIDAGAGIEYISNGRSPLQIAANLGYVDMAKFLMERGANVNTPAYFDRGATALQFAALNGNLGLAKVLVEHGADINAPPARYSGRTALEAAAEHGRLDMIEFLLERGANLSDELRVNYVRSVRLSITEGHPTIGDYLKQYRSWTEQDQTLYDRLGIRDPKARLRSYEEPHDWHVRMTRRGDHDFCSTCWSRDAYPVEDDITILEETSDPSYGESAVWHKSERAIEEWLQSLVDTFDESLGLGAILEENNRVIVWHNNFQHLDYEKGGNAVLESVEVDWGQEFNGHQENADSERAAGKELCNVVGEQELGLETIRMPEMVNEEALTAYTGAMRRGNPFFGADEQDNVWDI